MNWHGKTATIFPHYTTTFVVDKFLLCVCASVCACVACVPVCSLMLWASRSFERCVCVTLKRMLRRKNNARVRVFIFVPFPSSSFFFNWINSFFNFFSSSSSLIILFPSILYPVGKFDQFRCKFNLRFFFNAKWWICLVDSVCCAVLLLHLPSHMFYPRNRTRQLQLW